MSTDAEAFCGDGNLCRSTPEMNSRIFLSCGLWLNTCLQGFTCWIHGEVVFFLEGAGIEGERGSIKGGWYIGWIYVWNLRKHPSAVRLLSDCVIASEINLWRIPLAASLTILLVISYSIKYSWEELSRKQKCQDLQSLLVWFLFFRMRPPGGEDIKLSAFCLLCPLPG